MRLGECAATQKASKKNRRVSIHGGSSEDGSGGTDSLLPSFSKKTKKALSKERTGSRRVKIKAKGFSWGRKSHGYR